MNQQYQETAELAADVQATMAALPGPGAIPDRLMHCTEPECRICRGCAALLGSASKWIN